MVDSMITEFASGTMLNDARPDEEGLTIENDP